MTTKSTDYALLSQDSYIDRLKEKISDKPVFIGENKYKILDTENNRLTGYQGTAYQKLDANDHPTGEVIIAHRGSEFDREPFKDGFMADGGMVTTGLNAQASAALAFTERAMAKARAVAENERVPLHITVTGHSLGGALAELTAYKFHLHGVTFNGYGAADLGYHLPEGGDLVINYVRATDVVSAVSHHFGKVVVVATADDIRQLAHNGYHDHATTRNPFGAISAEAHSITNFIDQPGRPSDLSAENEARARAHQSAISLFREDVHDLRANVLSLAWRLDQKKETAMVLGGAAATALLHGDRDMAEKLASLAAHRTTDNLTYAVQVATNTAMLGITAIDQAGAYIADGIQREAHAVSQAMEPVSHVIDQAGAHLADHVKHDARQLNEAVQPGIGAIDQANDYLKHSADGLVQRAQRVAQEAERAIQPFISGVAHYSDVTRGVSATPPQHEQERPAPEHEVATAHRVDVSAITPHSSIDDMFEALYQACVADDHAAISAVSQAYLQSPDGQAFLQQGREYNQQLEMQQALEQQMARKGPAMSR